VRHLGDRVIYDLTRLNEFYPKRVLGVLGLIFIARSKDFYTLLGRAELSTLGRNYITFPSYRVSQIVEILEQRVDDAFCPGVVSRDVLEYIADVTASHLVGGDVRYALDLLIYSGNLAERIGRDVILPDDVRKVHGETHPNITTEDILNLPDEGKVTLMALARALQTEQSPYVSLGGIRDMCDVICEEYGLKPLDTDEHIQDLADRGIVEIKSLRKIGISRAPTQELYKFLDNLMDRVKERLR
jgi:cell division control protein 6